jgi:hypothetical protein
MIIEIDFTQFKIAPPPVVLEPQVFCWRPIDFVPERSAQADRITKRLAGYRVMMRHAQYYRRKFNIEPGDEYQHDPDTAARVIELAESLSSQEETQCAA